jgi:GT2 family glycosyltransferase
MGISVVVSSHLSEVENKKFKGHLSSTCGLKDIEVLIYPNFNEFSLSQIYNRGLKESKHDIVLFLHNDITFENFGWGPRLIKHFKNSDYGILGIAGTTELSSGSWWEHTNRLAGIVNHLDKDGKKFKSSFSCDFGDDIINVCCVDGLFIAVHKERIVEDFDERFKGFHFYDISFCVANYIKNVPIGVIFNILVTHASQGETNQEWYRNKLLFEEIYQKHIPINLPCDLIYDEFDVNIPLKKQPLVTAIIPTKGNLDVLFNCLESIENTTKYQKLEIIIADTGSSGEELEKIREFLDSFSIKNTLICFDYYNFSKINNTVIQNHINPETELLLFCNNDIELVNDAISLCVEEHLSNSNAGCVGIRLHYEDNSIQHRGVFLSYDNKNSSIHVGHLGLHGYYNYSMTKQKVFGITGAFLMINKNLFLKAGMFNENYNDIYQDVELNIKTILNGKENILIGQAVAYHVESLTRGIMDKNRNNDEFMKNAIPLITENFTKLSPLVITS